MPTHARERLVKAAEDLFFAEGIRAVGVERLLRASGVGRASFYRHFASKDDLVATMLRGYDTQLRAWLREVITRADGDPLAMFDGLATRLSATNFRGCASINTMVELADPDDPTRRIAVEHKEAMIRELRDLLGTAPDDDLPEQLLLLFDGALVSALREHSPAPARRAKAVAAALLASRPA
ncbi:TetR/AcrR family transcriptional regulator [Amycolatopsis samaneae]|uniref:TetR/AcrR family transcriptional regulator n=1 Tax=Amycolatopsis samaneae TaxID=664691 RepID=A0ABW5GI37_9PSEU